MFIIEIKGCNRGYCFGSYKVFSEKRHQLLINGVQFKSYYFEVAK